VTMGPETRTAPEIPARIIRPAPDGVGAAGGRNGGKPLELNLEDVQRLAERLLRDARDRVGRLDAEARALEATVATRRKEVEAEDGRRRADLEEEMAREGARLREEIETARREAVERGFAEGRERGHEEGYGKGLEEGREEGRREGREAGHREAHEAETARIRTEAEPLAATLSSMVREIGARRAASLRSAREELLPLAIEIAKKVVKREIRECPDVVLRNVRKAIDLAFRRTALTVQVHPEDAALVEKHAPEIAACFAGIEAIAVRPVEDVGRGGCRVVSNSGVVDMRVEAQLEVIEQALFRKLAEGDPEEESPAPGGDRREASGRAAAGPLDTATPWKGAEEKAEEAAG